MPKRLSRSQNKKPQRENKPVYHPWDRRMKRLFREAPQDFVRWLLRDAEYIRILSSELDGDQLYADILLEVLMEGKRVLLHVEFQRSRDSQILKRVWAYNVRATLQYDCPVWSVIIYLKQESVIAETTFTQDLPTGQPIHKFYCGVIRMWETPLEDLKRLHLLGLHPLFVLSKDGARPEVVEEAITGLLQAGEDPKRDLLTVTYGLASLAFEGNPANQEWLIRRFEMLYDILRDTPAFKELTKESLEQGLKEGHKEGLEKGHKEGLEEGLELARQEKLKELRQAIANIVRKRFPKLTRLAKKQVVFIEDSDTLLEVIVKMSAVQTAQEAQEYLLALDEDEEDEEEE